MKMGHGPPPFAWAALFVLVWSFCAPATTPKHATDSSGGRSDGADAAEDAAVLGLLDQRQDIDGPLAFSAWPSDGTVVVACGKDSLGKNLSGLAYQPPSGSAAAMLWAVQNDPAKLHRLSWDGTSFVPVTSDAWATGKLLRYPSASGRPDAEGVTQIERVGEEMYVVAERNMDMPDLARQSVLRYELGSSKGVLDATNEWLLTDDQPMAEPNHGIEGIAWIPDTYLVEPFRSA
jgi:hypothetical protein